MNWKKNERGIYTGAIGLIHEDKKIFNVAIRTIHLNKENKNKLKGEIGIGSGIVWDSNPKKNMKKCCLKVTFYQNHFLISNYLKQ